MFSPADIADSLATGLASAAGALDREQSPCGLDSLDERALHPILADGLRAHGFGAFLEQRYPLARTDRRRSHGARCDVVATPDARPLRARDDEPSLFAPGNALAIEDA
ncbi:MAG: hypothetical protein JNK53_08365, partial [Phycisphaerae bacterium]|nr:hypothetical protein [Phycisphaerae bacterium]